MVMEATGDYWRPFYYVLEEELNIVLVNGHEARNVPGRKTDISDAAWLADLGAHGLVRASFVPPAPIRELRDLTRARTIITRGAHPRYPAPGEAARGRLPQTLLRGLGDHRSLGPGHARSPDRRGRPSGSTGRSGQTTDALKDPGADRKH